MNAEKERDLTALARRNPFWICLIIFVVLAGDYAFRMANLIQMRQQLLRLVWGLPLPVLLWLVVGSEANWCIG